MTKEEELNFLKEQNKTLKLLVSTLSHDIVGPVGFSANILDTLAKNPDEDMTMAIASALHQSHKKAEDVLGLMRCWSRNDENELWCISKIYLPDFIEPKVEFIRTLYPLSKIEWDVKESLTVKATAVSISTALENVLTNAAKYTPEGLVIKISCYKKDGKGIIKTFATANEISPEILAALNDKSSYTKDGRASLGLFVSHS
ncbi:MAG: hypothetical protein PHD21_08310, partial [Flavobacteriales bacterium]|nr:hypothetical protein [Flavobacteriales bacterium]